MRLTHVWWLAGRRVTLHTRYFLRMVPQCVTSTLRPKHNHMRRDWKDYRNTPCITCCSKCLVIKIFKPLWIPFVYCWRHWRTELKWNLHCTSLLLLQTKNTTQIVLKVHILCSSHQIIHINLRVLVVSHRCIKTISSEKQMTHNLRWGWGTQRTYSCTHRSLKLPVTSIKSLYKRLTFDFFGELDSVGIGERAGLLVNVVDVQDLTHELDDWLCFVKGRGWY